MVKEVLKNLSINAIESYNNAIFSLPWKFGEFINILFFIFIICIYASFIWKFYHFIARKNFLELNLHKRKNEEYSSSFKIFLYFLEYIIISPFLIFFCLIIFGLFMVIMINNDSFLDIIFASTVALAAVRVTSYYNEPLSKELAKLIPLTLLAFIIITPGYLDFSKIITKLFDIPLFFNQILTYFYFIFILESILRFFDFISSLIANN